MERRTVLGLAAVATALPTLAWAQSKAAGAKGAAELQHMRDTLEAGSLALASAQIGLQKATDPWVKKFAQYETAEQQTVAEVLKSAGAAAPRQTAQEVQAASAKLNQVSGAEFDAAFLADQQQGHQRLLAIQETYIRSGSDIEQIGQAKLARAQILEHLDLIATIKSQLRA